MGTLTFGLSLKRIEHFPINSDPLEFNAQRAYNFTGILSKTFPNRTTWSDSRRGATGYLKGVFQGMGYKPRGMRFHETIGGTEYTDLENVYAEKRGTTHPDEIIVVMAHYDIVDTTTEGAMDDASGVGVVLELARLFAKEETNRTVIFLLTDSEEYGAFWGARAFVRQFDRAHQIVAAASFDFLAPGDQTAILTLCDGLKTGYTPLWLREMALDSLKSIGGFKVRDFTNAVEFAERAIEIPPADHAPLLAAGIPAFNWVGQMDNFAYQMTHYHHTTNDNFDQLKPESFDTYGRAAERLVRSVDALTRIPENFRDSNYWKITQQYYMRGWPILFLHFLTFVPFLVFSLSKFTATLQNYPRRRIRSVLSNEAKNAIIVLAALLTGYVMLLLLPALKVITNYEIFPATPKNLLLHTPNFLAILLVLGVMAGVYWLLRRTFHEVENDPDYLDIRRSFHGAFLAIIIFLAFLKNSYLGVLLLLPPAYLWCLLRSRRRLEDRVINTVILLSGLITLIIMSIIMTTIFNVGIIYWYFFLSAAYGLFSAYTVVLFFMALAILIRLFRAFVL